MFFIYLIFFILGVIFGFIITSVLLISKLDSILEHSFVKMIKKTTINEVKNG